MEDKDNGMSRRHFIETAALTGAGIAIVPRHVLGRGFTPPSDLLNIACVGIGGMGHSNMRAVGSQNIVALCDVDWDYAEKANQRYARELEARRNPPAPRQAFALACLETFRPAPNLVPRAAALHFAVVAAKLGTQHAGVLTVRIIFFSIK